MDAPGETRDFARSLRRKLSLPEGLLWRAIKGRKLAGLHFRKQHPIGPYVLDFYCHEAKLAVEVDGQSQGLDGSRKRTNAVTPGWLRKAFEPLGYQPSSS
jgi:very-short-patch-repair endonuclease